MTGTRKQHQGFTLLETLVALAVLSIGGMAAVFLYSSGMRASSETDSRTVAASLAHARIEELSSMSGDFWPSELSSGRELIESGLNRQGEFEPGGKFTRRSIVRKETPTPLTCEIEVSVTWVNSRSSVSFVAVAPNPL